MVKKILNFSVALILIATLGACSKTDSSALTYSKDGIGVLKFGGTIGELPAKVDGMYDRIDSFYDDFDGSTHNYLYLGEQLMYDITDGDVIQDIIVYDKNVDFGGFSVGDPMTKILSLDLVYDLQNSGMQVSANGCNLWLGEFSESGEDKSYRAYGMLEEIKYEPADFTESATLRAVNVYYTPN